MNIKEKTQTQNTSGIKESSNQVSETLYPFFLTSKQLGQWLNMSPGTAMRLLKKYNIHPVDLGRGRGKGLRWRFSEVIKFVDMLHTEAQAKKDQRHKKISPYVIRGKSARDLFAEFNGSVPLKAEVCNGD